MSGMSGNDKTPLGKLRLEFCADTGYNSPAEAIEAGVKSLEQWLNALEKHRIAHPHSVAKTTTSAPIASEIALRKELLEWVNAYCIKYKWGVSAKELAAALRKSDNLVRDLLAQMVEEGLLTAVKILRAKKGNVTMYRIAGIDEVTA
jgi:hypothetical protein